MIVVKVGGSLFDWPALGPALRACVDSLRTRRVVLVPGGGALADAIRNLDRVHRLGEEDSHWLAMQALGVNAGFLKLLLPKARIVWAGDELSGRSVGKVQILDPDRYFMTDEIGPAPLPHSWKVTSDSLSARVALNCGAEELILLKSVRWDRAGDWDGASAAGVVDPYFPRVFGTMLSKNLRVRVINLREWTP